MNKHKQVLKIGRETLGCGCTYSEENTRTRRIKYCRWATAELVQALRDALDAAGLNEVQVKIGNRYHYNDFDGSGNGAYIYMLEPVEWARQ